MNVLFTHGYFLEEDLREQKIMKPYPPLGILYIAAWLEKHGISCEVFDTTFSSKNNLHRFLLNASPNILAIYTNLMTKLNVLDIIRFVRRETTLKNTWIVLGGPDVTHNLDGYLAAGADFIVVGEGEQTMLELTRLLLPLNYAKLRAPDIAKLIEIEGLAFYMPDNTVHKTPPRKKLKNLDDLPFPARNKINLQQYLDVWKSKHGMSAISISTQRGCPYTCNWCSTAVYGQSYRRRSAAAVVDEIQYLMYSYDFELIWFVDDVFTVSHVWLNDFHQELKKRRLEIQFECITRADRLNVSIIEILKAAGCFRVWIGAESGSQKIIDAMDRRVNVRQVQEMIQASKKANIETGTFIMLGYPGETETDIFETVKHLKISNPDYFTITVAYPIRGTGLFQQVENQIITKKDWAHSTDRDLDFARTYPRRYYDFAVRWVTNSVRYHQKKLSGNLNIFQDLQFLIKIMAARLGMFYVRIVG